MDGFVVGCILGQKLGFKDGKLDGTGVGIKDGKVVGGKDSILGT